MRFCVLALGILLATCGVAQGIVEVPCRVLYGSWDYPHVSRVGLDADYDKCCWVCGEEVCLGKLDRNSLLAAASNVTYIVGLKYVKGETHEPMDEDIVCAVNEMGQSIPYAPSPIDETYWDRIVEDAAVAIANLSLYRPIWGVVLDLENYRQESIDPWHPWCYSYDEPALMAFANASGIVIPSLDPGDRRSWLESRGVLEDYISWQEEELRALADETEQKVHAINPNLSLGTLAFADAWTHWSVLEGFSSPLAPVTAWTEKTYGGYRTGGDEGMDSYQKLFAEHGLDGAILPGLWEALLTPWDMIVNMEAATRHNGAFWIYQHDEGRGDDEEYSRAYELFNMYIFFNQSKPDPSPVIQLFPGVEARPYCGPKGCSILLLPDNLGPVISDGVTLMTNRTDLVYLGRNLSVLGLATANLSLKQLPCLVYGLTEDDLFATQAWNIILELSAFTEYCEGIGLEEASGCREALDLGLSDYHQGRYREVISRLQETLNGAYATTVDQIMPQVEAGLSSPKDSPIPLTPLIRIGVAKRMLDEGDEGASTYLLAGLKGWLTAIPEPPLGIPALALGIFLLARLTTPTTTRRRSQSRFHLRLAPQGQVPSRRTKKGSDCPVDTRNDFGN
jgi:hypothetical protein